MGFVAYEVSMEIVKTVGPLIQTVARKDRALADQMRRAATSVPLNIVEGSRRKGLDRKHSYRVAAGSADELRAALTIAREWGYVDQSSAASVDALLNRELALLGGLTKP